MSVILLIISNLIKATTSYLRLKTISFYYDVSEKHTKRKHEMLNEINRLRNIGDTQSTDLADRMFRLLEEENSNWDTVSAAYFASKGGLNDSN